MIALCSVGLDNKAGPKPNATSWGFQERATHAGVLHRDLKRAKTSFISTILASVSSGFSSMLHTMRITRSRGDSSRTLLFGEPNNKNKINNSSRKGEGLRKPRTLDQTLSCLRASVLIMFPPSRRRLLTNHKHLLQGIPYRRLSR